MENNNIELIRKNALNFQNFLNQGVDSDNHYKGIENTINFNKEKEYNQNPEEKLQRVNGENEKNQRKYYYKALAALDIPHTKDVALVFRSSPLNEGGEYYSDGINKTIYGSVDDTSDEGTPSGINHELGHYLDEKWLEDIAKYLGTKKEKFGVVGNGRNHYYLSHALNSDKLGQFKNQVLFYPKGISNYKTEKADILGFLDDYKEFMEDIGSKGRTKYNNEEYFGRATENFARFISFFVNWVRNKAGKGNYLSPRPKTIQGIGEYEGKEETFNQQYDNINNFTDKDAINFIKLLQKKKALDKKYADMPDEAKKLFGL